MARKKLLKADPPEVVFHQPIQNTNEWQRVEGKTKNQGLFIKSIVNNPITIAIGNAGVGKTSVAIGSSVLLLKTNRISKIIISRPAIPVFEQIGFMPGDQNEKMAPYIMPMKREFDKFLAKGEFEHLIKNGTIEIVPLCFLQGWNIDGLLIVDEAGLLHKSQFDLIFTRLCNDGRIVVIGDPSQDGGTGTGASLEWVASQLEGLNGIGVIRFDENDNQRHPLINTVHTILTGETSRAPIPLEKRLNGYYDNFGKEWKTLYR